MQKLITFQKELEKFEKGIRELRLEYTEKQVELKKLEQEKKNYILDNFGDNRDPHMVKAFDIKIREAQDEIDSLEEQIALLEVEKKRKFTAKLDDLKEERKEYVEQKNSEFRELEKELYKKRFEFMQEIEKVIRDQRKLASELDEYTQLIRKFEKRDTAPQLASINTMNKNFIIRGEGKAPIAPTDYELNELSKVNGRLGAPRLSFSYLLFKETGEVEVYEQVAKKKYMELKKKGAK